MKVKKIEKKLTLNKKTVADLGIDEQKVIKGGTGSTKLVDCDTLPRIRCTQVIGGC
jgi:hypothetical protein